MSARARSAVVAIAALGTLISIYLTSLHYSGDLALCVGVGGCEAVQSSRFSTIGTVPVALLGSIGFVGMLVLAFAQRERGASLTALFTVSLAAVLYVGYLSCVEVFVLGAICPWCVSVALCAAAIFALTARAVWNSAE